MQQDDVISIINLPGSLTLGTKMSEIVFMYMCIICLAFIYVNAYAGYRAKLYPVQLVKLYSNIMW